MNQRILALVMATCLLSQPALGMSWVVQPLVNGLKSVSAHYIRSPLVKIGLWGTVLAVLGYEAYTRAQTPQRTAINPTITPVPTAAHVATPAQNQAQRRLARLCGHLVPSTQNTPVTHLETQPTRATMAHLSRERHRTATKEAYGKALAKHREWIDDAVTREHLYKNTHQSFYHAQSNGFMVYQDFLKYLYTWEFSQPVNNDFIFMRWWHDSSFHEDVNTFLEKEGPFSGGQHSDNNDNNPRIYKQLLAANLSLTGNIGHSGESSISYYLRNRSINLQNAKKLFEPLFDYYGFNKQYIEFLCNLGNDIATEKGSMLQVLVPHSQVNNCVYACQPWGVPLGVLHDRQGNILCGQDYNTTKNRYVRSANLIKSYCDHPEAWSEQALNEFQVRILLQPSRMLHPASGVKIKRYTEIPYNQLADYKDKMAKLCNQIFATASKHRIAKEYRCMTTETLPAHSTLDEQESKKIMATLDGITDMESLLVETLNQGDFASAQALIRRGVNINKAYLLSATYDNITALKWLTELRDTNNNRVINVHTTDGDGKTILMYTTNLNLEAAQFLWGLRDPATGQHLINFQRRSNDGKNALMHAAGTFRNTTELLKFLTSLRTPESGYVFDVNAQDNNGQTALMEAAVTRIEAVRFLLGLKDEHGRYRVDLNIRNNKGETALMQAYPQGGTWHGSDVIKLLEQATKERANTATPQSNLPLASRL